MATETFRSNFRQEGTNSGMITKTIKSNKEQIINTGVESKYFAAGQVGQLRFQNLAEFSSLVALKTFSEFKGKVAVEPSVSPQIPITGRAISPPAIEIKKEVALVQQEGKDVICKECGTKMILASDTNSSGAVRQMFFCPKCSHEQDSSLFVQSVETETESPVKVEAEQPRRGRRRVVPKTGEIK